MKKEAILEMARKAGCGHESMTLDWIAPEGLTAFANAILERAALACESRMSNAVLSDESSVFDCEAAGCAMDIRALKTKE